MNGRIWPAILLAGLLLSACGGGEGESTLINDDTGGSSSSSSSSNSSSNSSSTSSSSSSSNSSSTSTSGSGPTQPPVVIIPNGALGGAVDSSLIARGNAADIINHSAGINAVYLYAGNVTPDDLGSTTPPVAVAPVAQVSGFCTWRYLFNSVAPGDYTIAFTNAANQDNPGGNDAITFIGAAQITVSGSVANEHNFAPTMTVVRVGPSHTHTTINAAANAIGNNTIVEIDAGTYVDDISRWTRNNVVIRGVGGRAHLRADNIIPNNVNGKGIWVTQGSNIRVENIEFSGSRVPDENGAGIRAEGNNLSICNSYFHNNENGILGEAYGIMLIEFSEFNYNGLGEYGRTHNLYITSGNTLVFRYNYSHHAYIGHNLKTRAAENYIFYNRIMDEATGNSSYAVDIPNGGLSYLVGNLLQQGPNTDNSAMVSYGVEGYSTGRIRNLYAINNTMVNDYNGGRFFSIQSGATTLKMVNNIFARGGTTPSGAEVTNNLVTSNPNVVDISNYDYQLTATSSGALNAGINPGTGDDLSLTPLYEYVHPRQYRVRPVVGALDIGAYEYNP